MLEVTPTYCMVTTKNKLMLDNRRQRRADHSSPSGNDWFAPSIMWKWVFVRYLCITPEERTITYSNPVAWLLPILTEKIMYLQRSD